MATPTFSQHVGGGSLPLIGGTPSPGRRFKFSLPNSIGSGNMILLGLSWPSGIGNPTITDSLGNSWPASPNASADAGAGNMISTIWVLPNSLAGANIITVKFPAVVNEFQYCVSEFYNVATSGSGTFNGVQTTGATPVASPACGSFTPTNTVGVLIWTYFCSSNLIASGNPSLWTPTATGGITPTLLDADIGWTGTSFGMPHASQYFVQPTSGAINPAATLTGDAVDTFNCLSIAIPAASAGTAPAAGIRIQRICHFSTNNFPTGAGGTYVLQIPTTGNCGLLTSTDPNTTVTGVSDSQSNTWVHAATITGDNFWYFAGNSIANTNSRTATISTSAGANKLSWRYVDIAGVNTASPVDVQANIGSTGLNGAVVFDNAPTISPSSATGGVIIANVGLGQGPGYGFDTGAPSGAVFDLLTYINCRFTATFTTTTNLNVTAIADGDLAVGDFVSDPATQAVASITVSAGGGTGNYTTTTTVTTGSLSMFAGEFDQDYADNADLMAHVYYGAGGGTFHWNWVMVNMTTNSGSGGAIAFAAAALASPDVPPSSGFRTWPTPWNRTAALLRNTAQDFSSLGVETNPQWRGRTWSVPWNPLRALMQNSDPNAPFAQPDNPTYFTPRTWLVPWKPMPLARTTAQDFSSFGVETNPHWVARTWPVVWTLMPLGRSVPTDVPFVPPDVPAYFRLRTWPIVWTPLAALGQVPAPFVLIDTPTYFVPRTWSPQWNLQRSLTQNTAQDFSSFGIETNIHYISRTWPFQWNVQQSLMRGTPQDFSSTPPVVVGYHILTPMGARLITPIGI